MTLTFQCLCCLAVIAFVIGFFLIKGRQRKITLAAGACLVLLGIVAGGAVEREGFPLLHRAAPISAAAQVIFSGANMEGQMAVESVTAGDGIARWRHLLNIKQQNYALRPLVSDNIVYVVGSDQAHNALVLSALQSQHGDLLWSRVLGTYAQDSVWEGAGPLSLDGKIYIAVGHNINFDSLNESTTTLYALRASDGVTLWSRQLPSLDYQPSQDWGNDPAVLAADDGRLFVNEADGKVHALRASDGTEVWSAEGGAGTLGAGNGILYQRGPLNDLSILALRESDGAHLWIAPFDSVHSMAVEGKYLVAVTMSGSSDENLKAFLTGIDASSGKVLWNFPIENTTYRPLASDGVVYFTDEHTLDVLRISDGHLLWQEQVPDLTDSWFVVAAASAQANVLFVITDPYVGEDPLFDPATCNCLPPTKVYALNAHDGSAYWQYQPPLTSSTEGFLQIDVSQ